MKSDDEETPVPECFNSGFSWMQSATYTLDMARYWLHGDLAETERFVVFGLAHEVVTRDFHRNECEARLALSVTDCGMIWIGSIFFLLFPIGVAISYNLD